MKIFYCVITVLLAIQTACIFNLSRQNYDRYELKQLGSSRKDQFLLDKRTGKVWNIKSSGLDGIYFKKVEKLEEFREQLSKEGLEFAIEYGALPH